MKRIIYLIIFLIAAIACKEVFVAPPQALLQATLLNSNSITGATLSSTITISGIGIENTLYKDTTISELLLPLSTNDTTSFLISFDSTIDTITFIHETTMKYVSMESGFYNEFKLHSIDFTKHRIDSILITDSLVTKTWHENIKLYIRPLPAGSN